VETDDEDEEDNLHGARDAEKQGEDAEDDQQAREGAGAVSGARKVEAVKRERRSRAAAGGGGAAEDDGLFVVSARTIKRSSSLIYA
jgi:hypothetical protein